MFYFDDMIRQIEDVFRDTGATKKDLVRVSGVRMERVNAILNRKVKGVQYKTYYSIIDGIKNLRKEYEQKKGVIIKH